MKRINFTERKMYSIGRLSVGVATHRPLMISYSAYINSLPSARNAANKLAIGMVQDLWRIFYSKFSG